jgi:hypothetical protein
VPGLLPVDAVELDADGQPVLYRFGANDPPDLLEVGLEDGVVVRAEYTGDDPRTYTWDATGRLTSARWTPLAPFEVSPNWSLWDDVRRTLDQALELVQLAEGPDGGQWCFCERRDTCEWSAVGLVRKTERREDWTGAAACRASQECYLDAYRTRATSIVRRPDGQRVYRREVGEGASGDFLAEPQVQEEYLGYDAEGRVVCQVWRFEAMVMPGLIEAVDDVTLFEYPDDCP